jgi:exodeoxyribonuclease-3
MKIISWNVNGINSCTRKGAITEISKEDADVYCFQEVKAPPEKMPKILESYHAYHQCAARKGYSGVSIYAQEQPISVIEGIGVPEIDSEGRVVTAEFKDLFVVNTYFPSSNRELTRLDFKLKFNEQFAKFCNGLNGRKPIVIASDFNVAHKEIDLANPRQNMGNAGFTDQERQWFDGFLKEGYLDTFREFMDEGGHYTWWLNAFNARERNVGWRIDYFVVSQRLKARLRSSKILNQIKGSDHCPIALEIM